MPVEHPHPKFDEQLNVRVWGRFGFAGHVLQPQTLEALGAAAILILTKLSRSCNLNLAINGCCWWEAGGSGIGIFPASRRVNSFQ